MIDRNRSLIHLLMAGLVGLTLGLFVGWWVWPVQWIDAPGTAPATAPAASAPAQSVESPAGESGNSDSSYSVLMEWVNQGLLYVAAALLLVGGVVIGYQLLRQSQDKDSKESPFPLPFSRSRSKQATVARDRRTQSPPLAGRPARPRQPTLNWLRRGAESENAASTEEPVFREQSVDELRTGERSPISRMPDSETSPQETQRNEADGPWSQHDDGPSHEPWTEGEAGSSIAPQEGLVEPERGPGSPVSYGAPAAPVQAGDDEQVGEPSVDWEREELSPRQPATDGDAERRDDVFQSGALPAVSEDEEIGERRDGEAREHWDDGWETAPTETTFREGLDRPETGTDAGVDAGLPADEISGGEELAEQDTEFARFQTLEPEIVDSVRIQGDTLPVSHSSGQQVGQFEANFAFGIQTYDESFTINAADGELLGACGMGINESVDRAAATSGQVRLLDIWLYDRTAVRSVSQPLVSPGFDVSGLDGFEEGSGLASSAPLEVRPGLTCTLLSDHIVLECTIKSVTFLDGEQAPMPFRSVSASLAIHVQS
ncbi:MAG: hypothetical protein OXI80_10055 [Caldilineaceae bacterium]|nr:hypothetical protein [Caldilineaceae bacterium]MDE0338001.1 hypothetical protein [Caldilineaceae bacterium]